MKKIICLFLILCMVPVIALADNFSKMSYNELVNIFRSIALEIMSRPEWKEVTVPTGDWIVGIDIPAGYYSIRPVKYGYIKIKDTKGSLYFSDAMDEGETIGKIELLDGYSIRIEDPFIFSAPKGLDF